MYRIAKKFSFSASHQIPGLPPEHRCARLHGHNYTVEVELTAAILNGVGFLRDYTELNALRDYLERDIDHRHLNDIFGDDKTSAECLAKYFYDWCKRVWPETSAVRVSENINSWAEYRP